MIRGQKFNYYRVLSPKRYIFFMALPYICQGTLQKEGRGDYKKIEITIGNIVRTYLKIKAKARLVAHACNPSIWKAEAGGLLGVLVS